ncbi:MAG: amidohydrolase family protein [Anaerolineae bacterium]|nr:amidohydrolase family protein [Anaerolineae bacterium]
MGDGTYSLSDATLVTPDQVHRHTTLTISGGRIDSLAGASAPEEVDLGDHVVYPGLINAHDHLYGTWWPRVAPGRPYANVYEWLAEYERSPVLAERNQNPVQDVYALGVYRNLIAGTTTIADHFRRIDGAAFYARFPVRVLHEYGRTWTPRARTAWGDDISTEYGRAVRLRQPYIIHLAEGVDGQVADEMDVLTTHNAVGRNTLIVHGIALRPADIALLAREGASVCWCPTSNVYLYERTADLPALLSAGVNVALGTDSAMTGALNLLEEMRAARRAYAAQAGHDLDPRRLVEMVTTAAARALLLDGRRGRIAPGYDADLIALPDDGRDPYVALRDAQPADIALVLCRGVPVYGDPAFGALFERHGTPFSQVLVSGRRKLIAGDLPALLRTISARTGIEIAFPFLPCSAPDRSTEDHDP